jgi:hypothetical protein
MKQPIAGTGFQSSFSTTVVKGGGALMPLTVCERLRAHTPQLLTSIFYLLSSALVVGCWRWLFPRPHKKSVKKMNRSGVKK